MVPKEASHTIMSATYRSPKTILGFFAIVIGILITGASIVVGVFSRVDSLHSMIPWILGFAAIVFVAIVSGIFITAWKDPTVLMLGQISGHDYIENRKLALGDSTSGEYIEEIPISNGYATNPPALAEPKGEEGSK